MNISNTYVAPERQDASELTRNQNQINIKSKDGTAYTIQCDCEVLEVEDTVEVKDHYATEEQVDEDEIQKLIAESQKMAEDKLSQLTTGRIVTSITQYTMGLNQMLHTQFTKYPRINRGKGWEYATFDELRMYATPVGGELDEYRYQYLDLSAPAGLTKEEANNYLKGKGILEGRGEYFTIAANKYNVNEIYLMAHANLETGNGKSQLATGCVYNGVVVYNMYGIGAVDSNPVQKGAEYAYKMGWTTPEAAIVEGAKWISENYINRRGNRQNTLYKMRWNPAQPGTHQYATDVAWATKQAKMIQGIYTNYRMANLIFDYPAYSGE